MIAQFLADLVVALAVLVSAVVAFKRLAPTTFVRCHWALVNTPLGRLLPHRWRSVASGGAGACGSGACGSGCGGAAGTDARKAPEQIKRA